MNPIAIFYHGVFVIDGQPLPNAVNIIHRQMKELEATGLLAAATEFHVGVNGGLESEKFVQAYIPSKSKVTYHGASSRAENPTIVMLEEWVKNHPGWNVLYFHSKGATQVPGGWLERRSTIWRNTMMQDLVRNWRVCVAELDRGNEIVASCWLWNMADGSQHIPAGNMVWIKSEFASKLPSIFLRERIKQDGIGALSSRFEAEVYWGNGPRPKVKSFRPPQWWNELNSVRSTVIV